MPKIVNPKFLKVKIAAMMLLILVSSIWFALASQPVQPVRVVTPDAVVMRRESLSLDQALDLSLAMGDGRRVNWEEVSNE